MEQDQPQPHSLERLPTSFVDLFGEQSFEDEAARLTRRIVEDPALAQYHLLERDHLNLTAQGYKYSRAREEDPSNLDLSDQEKQIIEEKDRKRAIQKTLPLDTKARYEEVRRRQNFLQDGTRLITDDDPDAQPLIDLLTEAIKHQDPLQKAASFMDYQKNTRDAWKHVPTQAIKDFFADRLFAKPSKFKTSTERSVRLESGDDEPIEVPADAFMYVQSFDSWLGNGIEGGASQKIATHYYDNDSTNKSKSLDAIKHYASLSTEIPPIWNVVIYVQPNGLLLADNGNGDSHRLAAALLRGQDTIKADSVTFKMLEKNEVVAEDGKRVLAGDSKLFDGDFGAAD